MKTYREWKPTQYDTAGLNLPDRQEWLVCPVIRTRDSGPLEESNFETTCKRLAEIDPKENDHETHRGTPEL